MVTSTVFYGKAKEPIERYKYESLVKGEVVAEGQIFDGGPQELAAGGILRVGPLDGNHVAWPVLVIRQKEDSVIQERDGR
jgi:hypothetical protein